MRKLLFSFFAVTLCASMFATETAKVTIQLTSSNATYGKNSITLKENTDRNASYESGYDAESMMSQANPHSVLLYGFVGATPCSSVATDNLDGLNIGLTTNMYDDTYRLVFAEVSGRALNLYDRVLNVSTPIVEGNYYEFTVEASQVNRVAVNDRFFINLDASSFAAEVTTNEYGWASFSFEAGDIHPLNASLKIYAGELNGDVLDLNEVDYVAGSAGVIVYGAPNTKYFFTPGTLTNGNAYLTNDLKPSSAWTGAADNIFCLKGDALYQYTGNDFPDNKAYLDLGSAPAPRRISFRFNETQAIENVEIAAPAEKFIENGQVFIKRGEAVYNLQGQMVR